MNTTDNSSTNSKYLNLIAVGAFFFYFLLCLSRLLEMLINDIGAISGLNPKLFFWGGMMLNLAVIIIVLRLWIQKIWRRIEANAIATKTLLITFGLLIFGIYLAQIAEVAIMNRFFIQNYLDSYLAYHNGITILDNHGIIHNMFSIVRVILMLIFFVKWK